MKNRKVILISFLTVFLLLFSENAVSAKVMWGKTELKEGQIGKVTILTNVNTTKIDGDTLTQGKGLKKGEEFRVYSNKVVNGSQYYGLGGGLFVQKSDRIKYETPSKAKLAQLKNESQWKKINPNIDINKGISTQTTIQLKDGKVMIIDDQSSFIYDYNTNKWSKAAPTIQKHDIVSPVLLPDGRVLVFTGFNGTFPATYFQRAEIYNPKTNKWSLTGNLNIPRGISVQAVVLEDGRVLAAGGENHGETVVEIYDPMTNKWSKGAIMEYSNNFGGFSFLPLKDGKILSIGGRVPLNESTFMGRKVASALEIYDHKNNTWSVHDIQSELNVSEKFFYLSDGSIFSITQFRTGIYHFDTKEFKPFTFGHLGLADAVEMQNGQVLITGVIDDNKPNGYLYSLKTKKLEQIKIPSNAPKLFMLPNGKVLALGSETYNNASNAFMIDWNVMYLYTPSK
ncbi:hypothetical protein RRV45_20325 [Bacillus sp. DTU_2020_1000418_1_SI_GHA_SEK_038]|uniref:Kelch repeat-containing protein n=1 Tax=Bacillus sp. DTU_2020_1000418_1_SI_GHA_SEK_038 TaxID=3077585 RepID=UPI0028EB4AE3|nr:hypothetical protein [Bacillus sp. DTU_2020_1000418_1_SI_GHA_SEK_038]WNS75192.1 hypothetical protein RRV45_20325 [Bacillus sp. DTU_2020_1000418_1_SI_GHA_SEK_038]